MTNLHLYGKDIDRLAKAIASHLRDNPFETETDNHHYHVCLQTLLNRLTNRPLPRPYPDRMILELDDTNMTYLTCQTCQVADM